MSANEFDFDLDDILREFSDEDAAPAVEEIHEVPVFTPPAPKPEPRPEPVPDPRPVKVQKPEPAIAAAMAEPIQWGKPKHEFSPLRTLLCCVFVILSVVCLTWMGTSLFKAGTDEGAKTSANLVADFDVYMNNFKSDAIGDLTYVKKIYTISENVTVAPAPNPTRSGSTSNLQEIQELIDSSAELIGDQEMAWDPNVEFYPGSEVKYYCDDSILVLTWKEIRDSAVLTCSEVVIADGSQLRRKLAGDTYGSEIQIMASEMASQVNAVVAINGDFYAFRSYGITAYQRQVRRFETAANVDTCHFTANGDMIFTRNTDFASQEEAQKFVDENDVTFSICFGPILVQDGVLQTITSYPLGEISEIYPRAAMGQLGEHHYLLMCVNIEGNYNNAATVQREAEYMYDKGCVNAYALDGGQTAVIVMDGAAVNRVSYGFERTMSDIIYFATAIPETEGENE